jgi:hypothetical protein
MSPSSFLVSFACFPPCFLSPRFPLSLLPSLLPDPFDLLHHHAQPAKQCKYVVSNTPNPKIFEFAFLVGTARKFEVLTKTPEERG